MTGRAVGARSTAALTRLQTGLYQGGSTQLGVGPMSRQCVDAAIDLANTARAPIMLIPSRRQIECEAQGGGYVNRWTTEAFVRYVRERDRGGYVTISRDHGGPWQDLSDAVARVPIEDAMRSAKESFRADIEAGFDLIHIDPSVDVFDPMPPQDVIVERLFELYEYCMEVANELGVEVAFEIGSEEQSGGLQDLERLIDLLERTKRFCRERRFPAPTFIVAQTGTLVKETRNVGTFDDPFRQSSALPAEILVPQLVETCLGYGIFLKGHNTDYLSNEALSWHPKLRIHAANVAPEFGVAQTRHLLRICEELGLAREEEEFLRLAYETDRWRKWLVPDSTATDRDRSIIAGHYTFGMIEFQDIVARIGKACEQRGVDLDASIRQAVTLSISRYMTCFNLVSN